MTIERDAAEGFGDESSLEAFLSKPNYQTQSELRRIEGDIIVLGVSGKMGPTLAILAKRADPSKRVIGVGRFTDASIRQKLEKWGVETILCDLLDPDAVEKLPKIKNVIYMAGRKFGTDGAEPLTWAMNTIVPANVARGFADSRIVAVSTGCVYSFVDTSGDGSTESMPLRPPPSDYTMSCVGRERVFQYYGSLFGTPGRLIRLNYAVDMRYGVLADVALNVFHGEPVDVSTGYVNIIWQGDANSQILRSLQHCTPAWNPLNVSGSHKVGIRDLAGQFGRIFNKEVNIKGAEEPNAWLTDTSVARQLFGDPCVSLEQMIKWTSAWVLSGNLTYQQTTHFDVRDGLF